MFCPNCKTEYRAGFTQCTDCGATLVAALEPAKDAMHQDWALAWRGSDPAGFSAAQAALDGAGIQSYHINDHDQLAWGLGVPRPRYGIMVRKSDLEAALQLVASIQERAPLANAKDIWKSQLADANPEDDAAEIPAAPENETVAPDDIPEEIAIGDATEVVWSGEASTLEILDACLRENGITTAVVPSGNSAKLLVQPKNADRAKEIVREVVEATPPE
jgi:hypothetical protein